ncbi:MAG: YceI family protein [Candidatus Eremiobacteraeota bacterium]|nr:YceI family protein [Candidatus Eremiobacteraeota bacterium]
MLHRRFLLRSFARAGALALVVALVPAPARAQVAPILPPGVAKLPFQRLAFDTDHSGIEFRVGFMGVSSVHGDFERWEGTMMYDPVRFERTTVTVAILAESVNTGVPARDRDLRSDHFFDAKKFPYIVFVSTGIVPHGQSYTMSGNLTMHGVTKAVALDVTPLHPLVRDAWRNERIGFTGKTSLNRKDFGIEGIAFWNNEFDPGRRAIADRVDVELTVEAELANMGNRSTPQVDALMKQIDSGGVAPALAGVPKDAPADEVRTEKQTLAMVGAKLFQNGQFADALAVYRASSGLDPSDATALAALGEAELLTGDRKRAVADFKRALAADPTNTAALEYLRHLGT